MQLIKRFSEREFNIHLAGSGQPVLFVHGFPLDHTMWTAQIDHFSQRFQVIAPDLRGFGQSPGTDDLVSMKEFADDLSAILDELEIDTPVHFCGLSMGGYIAWQFRQLHPQRLKSLILCDTKATADTEEAKEVRRATAKRVLSDGSGFLAEGMPTKLFSPNTFEQNPQLIEQAQEVIRKTSAQAIAAASLGMAERPDMVDQLSKIETPALVIVGEDDSISTSQEMREISQQMQNAQFVEIPNAGHMAPLEQPALVNQAIEQFLIKYS